MSVRCPRIAHAFNIRVKLVADRIVGGMNRMPYVPMYELLPEIAMAETRTITVFKGSAFSVPAGDYGLLEMYCNDEGCDCRRVFISVISSVTKDIVAVITFGWESKAFYAKWFYGGISVKLSELGEFDRQAVKDMHGIHLSNSSRQSEIAPAVLQMVTECALRDSAYVDRIKRHYKLFRAKVDEHFRDH